MVVNAVPGLQHIYSRTTSLRVLMLDTFFDLTNFHEDSTFYENIQRNFGYLALTNGT